MIIGGGVAIGGDIAGAVEGTMDIGTSVASVGGGVVAIGAGLHGITS